MEIHNSRIKKKKLEINKLTAEDLGRPVIRHDRGFTEYGLLMGWSDGLVTVSLSFHRNNLRLRPAEIYFVYV